MKIVLDTNVFISGIFFSGPPAQILKEWKKQSLQIILSKGHVESPSWKFGRIFRVYSETFEQRKAKTETWERR